jgi:hypothetical protein
MCENVPCVYNDLSCSLVHPLVGTLIIVTEVFHSFLKFLQVNSSIVF